MIRYGHAISAVTCFKTAAPGHHYRFFTTQKIQGVYALADWDLNRFRQHAFNAQMPATLPSLETVRLRACSEWFVHDSNSEHDPIKQPQSSELKTSFWSKHGDTIVPLELTSPSQTSLSNIKDDQSTMTFQRAEAPLKVLTTYLNARPSSDSASSTSQSNPSIYLAQCDIDSLPDELRDHLPTPDLVKLAGKGDIYSSSLWLGRSPTYTPLHRDPNPNLFVQLAGQKIVRLFAPEVGRVIFEDVQEQLSSMPGQLRSRGSASVRGDNMMQGMERRLLHRAVWGTEENNFPAVQDRDLDGHEHGTYLAHALDAKLGLGEALFIPQGWWHSVKGVGRGVTASVNWWFR